MNTTTHILLQTERMILRRFTADDAGNLFDLDSDPDVMRFLSGGAPTPRHVVESDILPRFLRYDERFPAFGFWAAVDRASGDFFGWFSFRPTHEADPREVHLGFRLRKAAWGRGYATEGVRALIRLGFAELGVQRVVATTYEHNRASRRVMEKAGMTLTRTFRLTAADLDRIDTYHVAAPDLWDGDDVEYSLHRADWQRQQSPGPPLRWTGDPFRAPVEQIVARHTGRPWAANDARDMTEFACHPCAILSDGSYSVFAKFSPDADGPEQFQVELAGLRLLSERSGVLTPTPLGILPVAGGTILVLEAVRVVDRTPRHWRQIGRALARIHRVKGDCFGLETHSYFGPLYQDNTPLADWPAFYAQRRLVPGLKLAVDSGHLPPALAGQIETLIARLPGLCGPTVAPVLLHGDAQQNNFLSTEIGPFVIDPAMYYGHPEMDLAALDLYQPVPGDVFDGYRDEMPIDPGFWDRRHLWRIWPYLAAVAVEGPGYLDKLAAAVQEYL